MKSWLIALAVLSVGLLSTAGLAFTGLPYFPLNVAFQQNAYAPPTISAEAVGSPTPWTFDFSEDPDFAVFSNADSLASARLTLSLTPTSPLTTFGTVKIEGLSGISPAQFQNLPINTTSTIQLELLDFYTSERILEILNQKSQGQIPMFYSGGATVSLARLDLTAE